MIRFTTLFLIIFTSLLGTPIETLFETLGVANSQEAQEQWSQQGERWTFQDHSEEERSDILSILEEMVSFEIKRASKNHYDYALVLGALYLSVEKRIAHLVDEYSRGVRFDVVVFLTGQRPLHPEKEANFSGTETDMMVEVWSTFPMPEELRALPLMVVDAPPLPERGRPTTESTLYAWLEAAPNPGSCLFISSQPFVNYQDAIIKFVLPES
ncbi:MAG: hypothetical protein K1060chlam2_01160, partial [Chlamydiae bacterium]|nr:hypothetical protein [Chlamydiota bacterium]